MTNHKFGFNQSARPPVESWNVPLTSTFAEIHDDWGPPKSASHNAVVNKAYDKPGATHNFRRAGQAPPNPKAKEEAQSRQQQVFGNLSLVSSARTQIEVSDGGEVHSHKSEECAEV
jgi:hypothetical protein